jgi:hypothetical protein
MRPVYRVGLILALTLTAPFCAPARAAEPDAPAALISPMEAVRLAIQNRLSAKFSAA